VLCTINRPNPWGQFADTLRESILASGELPPKGKRQAKAPTLVIPDGLNIAKLPYAATC
jgi:hypothetical protein